MALIASSFVFASEEGKETTTAEKEAILQVVMSDVMLRGALEEARKEGTCEGSVVSAIDYGDSDFEFEAQINCSAKADENTGGGTFLMINIKGRVFGNSLENSVIEVSKAG